MFLPLTLCLYGLVRVRVWLRLLMVLAPLSRLLLWEAGGLGGDIGSRLSLSDLGSDSSQESSTLELPSGETFDTLVSLPVSRCWVLPPSSCSESFVFRG